MSNHIRYWKRFGYSVALIVTLLAPAYAQEADEDPAITCTPVGTTLTEKYLSCIQQYTNGILQKTNRLPQYIKDATAYFTNWSNTEETKESVIPDIQSNFTKITNEYKQIDTRQKDQQQQIVTDFFKDPSDLSGKTPLNREQLPNANDLAYQTLLGYLYFPENDPQKKDQTVDKASRNYIMNAAGLSITHTLPDPHWTPKESIQRQRYFGYYNTVSAAQTYNGYVLSELYANKQSNFELNTLQKKLVDQVTGSDWTKQVGSDNLGLTLRHILLFDSQLFVLLTRMLEAQKQMIITQTVTNALLVSLNLGNEDMLVKKANGTLTLP